MDSDLDLLARWREGERQAGDQLFSRHFRDLYRFFEHKVGGEAEELTQRTFLACVRARDQFLGRSSFRTYLFSIARNEFHAHLRARRQNEVIDFGVTSVADLAPSPSSELGRLQQVERLRIALGHLPIDQQMLLELHYWHDLDAAALAEVFHLSPGAIRVRLVRARHLLKERLAEQPAATSPDPGSDRLLAALETQEP
jgi:RNA polymerase sigma factor (sigma-70 family)